MSKKYASLLSVSCVCYDWRGGPLVQQQQQQQQQQKSTTKQHAMELDSCCILVMRGHAEDMLNYFFLYIITRMYEGTFAAKLNIVGSAVHQSK
jgi:hypothetical protein